MLALALLNRENTVLGMAIRAIIHTFALKACVQPREKAALRGCKGEVQQVFQVISLGNELLFSP